MPPHNPRAGGHVILYDADCGLCRTTLGFAIAADRRGRLRPVALQDPEASRLLPGLSGSQRMASVHLVHPDNTVASAGEALAELIGLLAVGSWLSRALRARPDLVQRSYRWVAGNRDRIGPLVPRSIAAWSERQIDRRMGRS